MSQHIINKIYSFDEVWERIQKATPIKNYIQLAEITGTSKQTVSRKKKEKIFPVEWAFEVAQEYKLLTEWLMTGSGPVKVTACNEPGEELLSGYLAEWIKEQSKKDANFSQNFQTDCALAFPEFAEWLKKRKTFMAEGRDPRQNTA